MKKTIGIIGGMGPMATCDLFQKITAITCADTDQEHFHIIIDSNTAVPSRVDAIEGKGESPLKEIVKSAHVLEKAGADFLVMPCNTAHFYYDDIVKEIHIPLIHMVDETMKAVKEKGVQSAALLATDATVRAQVYDKYSEKYGIQLMKPSLKAQDMLMTHIFKGIKAGVYQRDVTALKAELKAMAAGGAEVFVLACTEIPILFAHNDMDVPYLDATLALAAAAIKEGGGSVKAGRRL